MKGVYLKVSPWCVMPISQTIMNDELRKQGYKINRNPYIKILPSVKSEVQFDLPDFQPPHRIDVDSIGFEPNIENPKKVFLDVSDDMVIQIWRDELMRQVPSDGMIDQPDMMKINLIEKTTDSIDSKVRDSLIEYCTDLKIPSEVIGVDLGEKIPEYMDNDV